MPAWSRRRIQGRTRGLQVIRWYSALVPSIAATDPAKTAAASEARLPSAETTSSVPTTTATRNAAWCRTPRKRGFRPVFQGFQHRLGSPNATVDREFPPRI